MSATTAFPCQHCNRAFPTNKGLSIHTRACSKKLVPVIVIPQIAALQIEEQKTIVVPAKPVEELKTTLIIDSDEESEIFETTSEQNTSEIADESEEVLSEISAQTSEVVSLQSEEDPYEESEESEESDSEIVGDIQADLDAVRKILKTKYKVTTLGEIRRGIPGDVLFEKLRNSYFSLRNELAKYRPETLSSKQQSPEPSVKDNESFQVISDQKSAISLPSRTAFKEEIVMSKERSQTGHIPTLCAAVSQQIEYSAEDNSESSDFDIEAICQELCRHAIEQAFEVIATSEEQAEQPLLIFTDSATRNNGQPTARSAWAVHYPNGEFQDSAAALDPTERQTNNRAELIAIKKALIQTESATQKKVIHTDSQFSIDCLTTYKQKWTTNGFKKADGSDVSNADILAEIYNLWSDRITLVHVLAHQKDDSFNSVHNNIVDKLAFRAASNAKPVDKQNETTRDQSVSQEQSMSFESQQTTEITQCSVCQVQIGSLNKCYIKCQTCCSGTAYNTRPVRDVYVEKEDDCLQEGETVSDLTPVVQNGRLFLYAPNAQNVRRLVQVKKLIFQDLNNERYEVTTQVYKATTFHIRHLFNQIKGIVYENQEAFEPSELSLMLNRELTNDQVLDLYQFNPVIGENKTFLQKIIIDFNVRYAIDKFVTVYLDTETTTADGHYTQIPDAANNQHELTIIQFLIDMQTGVKPITHIYHRQGYKYRADVLQEQYAADTTVQFTTFSDERAMVDAFWDQIIKLNYRVVMTGFNAAHDIVFKTKKDQKIQKPIFEHKFTGYDLKWLTARTSYRFTPKANNVKIDQDLSTTVAQIKELPNVLMIDYQGLALRRMDQKLKNQLDQKSLKGVLTVLFGGKQKTPEQKKKQAEMEDELYKELGLEHFAKIVEEDSGDVVVKAPAIKIDQNMVLLQKICHKQMDLNEPRDDMTSIMDYSINDVVCLYKCEKEMNYLGDQLINQMEFAGVGLYSTLIMTQAQTNVIMLCRLVLERGKNYRLQHLNVDKVKFTGAYTQIDAAYAGQAVDHVIQNDYNSLYPSIIRAYNISPETLVGVFREDQLRFMAGYQDIQACYEVVNISDDNEFKYLPNQSFAVYTKASKQQGILPTLCQKLTDLRNIYKKQAGNYPKQSAEYKRFNQLQNTTKVSNNAVFGGCGSISNPYYNYVVACSITAGARNALACLARGIHQIGGFIMSEEQQKAVDIQGEDINRLERLEPFFQIRKTEVTKEGRTKTEKEVTVWERNMFDKHSQFKTRSAAADTDAQFAVQGDMQWFQDAYKGLVDQKTAYDNQDKELKAIVANYLRKQQLQFACEEYIVKFVPSEAKKSYIRLDIKGMADRKCKGKALDFTDHYISTLKYCQNEDQTLNKERVKNMLQIGLMELQIKGVQWSNFHNFMRDVIRELFLDILLTNDVESNVHRVKCEQMSDYLKALDRFTEGDQSAIGVIERFAQRVKMSGKSPKVQFLRKRYPLECDTLYILPLKAQYRSQRKSELWIPIQCITSDNRNKLDDQSILNCFDTQIKKFFQKEKKAALQRREQALYDMDSDKILVNLETFGRKQGDQVAMTPQDVFELIKSNRQITAQEVIYTDNVKLFFDIDNVKIDLHRFEKTIKTILSRFAIESGDLKMFVAQRKDTSKKHSYHITFNVVMPLELVRIVASRAISILYPKTGQKDDDGNVIKAPIDTAPYHVNKTLRLPFSHKLNAETGLPELDTVLTTEDAFEDCCITLTDGYRFIPMPLCLSKKPIINFTQQIEVMDIPEINAIPEFKEVMKSIKIHQQDIDDRAYYKQASVRKNHLCPACRGPHESDNDLKLKFWQNNQGFGVKCFKANKQDSSKASELWQPYPAEVSKRIRQLIKQMPMKTNQEFATSRIPTQNQEHVTFDLKNDLTYILSNMGSGKTQQLIPLLKEQIADQSVVMLSVRQTLSTAWIARYKEAGLQVKDYRDITGNIKPQQNEITVIQVDSLCKLSIDDVGILVLDEIQSIISQLNSTQLKDKSGVNNRFIQLVKSANKVVALDANLHETTMDLLDEIRGETGHLVWNQRKTYSDVSVEMRKFQRNGLDDMLKLFHQKIVTENKNIVAHVTSIDKAKKIVAYLKEQKPDVKIRFYHGEDACVDGEEKSYQKLIKESDLKDVDTAWINYQLVIYTGTISAGIDFQKEHFHENISVFAEDTTSADQFIQGLMRVRKLVDKKITIYTQSFAKSGIISCESIYRNYRSDMEKLNMASNHILDPLFNLQLYLAAYARQQKCRSLDIILGSLNRMGMIVSHKALTADEQKACEIAKKVEIQSYNVSSKLIIEAKPITAHSVEYYFVKNDQHKKQELLTHVVNEQLQGDLSLITFVSTVYNKELTEMNAFNDKAVMLAVVNEKIQGLQQLDKADITNLTTQYQAYEVFKTNYKTLQPKDRPIYELSQEQVSTHLKVVLSNHDNQFSNKQKLKSNKLQQMDLPKYATEVQAASAFIKQLIADKQVTEQVRTLGSACGFKREQDYAHIATKVGLVIKRTCKRTIGKDRKTIRSYSWQLKPLFSDQVIAEFEQEAKQEDTASNTSQIEETQPKRKRVTKQ